jgi:hypothetical protein
LNKEPKFFGYVFILIAHLSIRRVYEVQSCFMSEGLIFESTMSVLLPPPLYESPIRVLISGPSQSGKTYLAHKFLYNRVWKFVHAPSVVHYYYNHYQPIYDVMLRDGSVQKFLQGMPSQAELEKLEREHGSTPGGSLIVVDDHQMNIDAASASLFSVQSHHMRVSVLWINQNLFPKNKFARDITLNASLIYLTKNPRDASVITNFAKQFMPGETRDVRDAYREATSRPYGYILFDLRQMCPDESRIRANQFGEGNLPEMVWIDEKRGSDI